MGQILGCLCCKDDEWGSYDVLQDIDTRNSFNEVEEEKASDDDRVVDVDLISFLRQNDQRHVNGYGFGSGSSIPAGGVVGSATKMLAASLDSQGLLGKNHRTTMSNIQEIKNRRATLTHGFDATQMENNTWFRGMTFDRIMYNLPQAGFIKDEPKESQISGRGGHSSANATEQSIPRPQPKPCSNVGSSLLQNVEEKHRVGSVPEVTTSTPSEDRYGDLSRGSADNQNVQSSPTQLKWDPFKNVIEEKLCVIKTPDYVITIPSEDRDDSKEITTRLFDVNSRGDDVLEEVKERVTTTPGKSRRSKKKLQKNVDINSSVTISNGSETNNNNQVLKKDIWIKHYCSCHKILIVGDGDFSFSACLAKAFGSADNMVATSLDSLGFLKRNYKKADSNIMDLKSRGCMVIHGFDATTMADHDYVKGIRFDRIIYNFPLAGFFKREVPRKEQLSINQTLVESFFKNAKKMISKDGEVHISHKCNHFFYEWNLKGLAKKSGFKQIEEVVFEVSDYPGYRTKYGFGGDKNFDCSPSRTYKFGLKQKEKKQCSNLK